MHPKFETLAAADAYFRRERLSLEIDYEQKQTILESNKQNVLATLKTKYESQLVELKQQTVDKKEALKNNSEKAKGQIQLLFNNKKEIIFCNNVNKQTGTKDNIQFSL